VALDWLFEHSDEPDDLVVTDDDVVMADVYSASRSQTNANVEAAKATEAGHCVTECGEYGIHFGQCMLGLAQP
jgi:UDP-N-acetylmuramate-alanine ligase